MKFVSITFLTLTLYLSQVYWVILFFRNQIIINDIYFQAKASSTSILNSTRNPDDGISPPAAVELSNRDEVKFAFNSALTQLIVAPSLIAQNLATQFGPNIQGVVNLFNTSQHGLQIKGNKTLSALFEVAAAHSEQVANQTSALIQNHLGTHKEIGQTVTALTEESVAEPKRNASVTFALKVENLFDAMDKLHANISETVVEKLIYKVHSLARKIKNLTVIPHHLMRHLAEDLDATRHMFEKTIHGLVIAVEKGIHRLGEHVQESEQLSEEVAVQMYFWLDEDYAISQCVEEVTVEYEEVFQKRVLNTMNCASETILWSLDAVFNDIDTFLLENNKNKEAVERFIDCHGTKEEFRSMCSVNLLKETETFLELFRWHLKKYEDQEVLEKLFQADACYIPESPEMSMESVQATMLKCAGI